MNACLCALIWMHAHIFVDMDEFVYLHFFFNFLAIVGENGATQLLLP